MASQLNQNLIKAIRDPKKAAQVLMYQALAPIGQLNYKKFVVLTRDRTGSNMLIQSLNSHPRIAADYEVFAKLYDRSEEEILDRTYGRQPFYIRAKGFKIFYYHPQDAEGSPVWELLQAVEGLHVIHLKRRNILNALVSSRVAYQTGVYGVRNEREASQYGDTLPTVRFTPKELEDDFIRNREWEVWGARTFADKPSLDVVYEDIAANLTGEVGRVVTFLGLIPHVPHTDFRKQRTRSLWDTVENYGDLKAHFQGTEWEGFFGE